MQSYYRACVMLVCYILNVNKNGGKKEKQRGEKYFMN